MGGPSLPGAYDRRNRSWPWLVGMGLTLAIGLGAGLGLGRELSPGQPLTSHPTVTAATLGWGPAG